MYLEIVPEEPEDDPTYYANTYSVSDIKSHGNYGKISTFYLNANTIPDYENMPVSTNAEAIQKLKDENIDLFGTEMVVYNGRYLMNSIRKNTAFTDYGPDSVTDKNSASYYLLNKSALDVTGVLSKFGDIETLYISIQEWMLKSAQEEGWDETKEYWRNYLKTIQSDASGVYTKAFGTLKYNKEYS